MGGICSKSSKKNKSGSNLYGSVGDYKAGTGGYELHRASSNTNNEMSPRRSIDKKLQEPAPLRKSIDKKMQEPMPPRRSMDKKMQEAKPLQKSFSYREGGTAENGSNQDDFYDGIPRYLRANSLKSRSMRSKQAASAKVSEVSSRIKSSSFGLGRAVNVLDTLGSSMSNLSAGSGFVTGATLKGNELSILAFEVANTIMKGNNLMQSLSRRSIKHLKEVVLPSEGVQILISKDMDELLRIFAADKREELKIFSGEVVRFGNSCKDPQWHDLDRYFEKISKQSTPQKQLKEEAEAVMQQLMNLVQLTAELYHESHALDRYEHDYQLRRLEESMAYAVQRGDGLTNMKTDLKTLRKQVRNLKKKSLWSKSLEEVMEKLVDIVNFLYLEIRNACGTEDDKSVGGSQSIDQTLGPAGLSLHYANIIIQIDTFVARSGSMPPTTRDALYQSLPPTIKSALRSKIPKYHVKEELTISEIKAEMEKTLQWLVPMATNTAKAHHGFGWVGEWANDGSETNRKASTTSPLDVIKIETLHHADKDKTEAYILEQLLWLNHLVNKAKPSTGMRSPMKSPMKSPLRGKTKKEAKENIVNAEDNEVLRRKQQSRGSSKSQDFDSANMRKLRKDDRLSKSGGHSPSTNSKSIQDLIKPLSLAVDLDAIDGADNLRYKSSVI